MKYSFKLPRKSITLYCDNETAINAKNEKMTNNSNFGRYNFARMIVKKEESCIAILTYILIG